MFKRKTKAIDTEMKLVRHALNVLAAAVSRVILRKGNANMRNTFQKEWGEIEKGFTLIDAAKKK